MFLRKLLAKVLLSIRTEKTQTNVCPRIYDALYRHRRARGAGVEKVLGKAQVVLLALGYRDGNVLDL